MFYKLNTHYFKSNNAIITADSEADELGQRYFSVKKHSAFDC